jgi:hypothetical protein
VSDCVALRPCPAEPPLIVRAAVEVSRVLVRDCAALESAKSRVPRDVSASVTDAPGDLQRTLRHAKEASINIPQRDLHHALSVRPSALPTSRLEAFPDRLSDFSYATCRNRYRVFRAIAKCHVQPMTTSRFPSRRNIARATDSGVPPHDRLALDAWHVVTRFALTVREPVHEHPLFKQGG